MDKGLKRTRRRKAAKVKVLRRRSAIRKAAKAERQKVYSGPPLTRDEQIRMAKLNLAKLETLQAEHDDYKKLREERTKEQIAADIDASCVSPTEGEK